MLLGFSVSLFESNQLFNFCSSFPLVSKDCSRFSSQPSKHVSPANKIVFIVLETSQILFRYQININDTNTEPRETPHSSFSSWRYTLPRSCSCTGYRLPHRLQGLLLITSMWMWPFMWATAPSCRIPQMHLTGISSVMKFKCEHFWWFSHLGFGRGEESSLKPGMLVHSLFLISAQQAVSQAAHFLQQILLSFHFGNTIHTNALKLRKKSSLSSHGGCTL